MDHALRELVELRFLINSNSANKITGDNICRLKKEFSVVATITGNYSQERLLAFKGYDIRTLCSALEDLLLSQRSNVIESGINWLLDEAQVNYLTSHSIEHLNSILESSSTLIDVYVLNCPLSSERVIKVKGEPSSIAHCIYDLCGLLKWCSVKKSVRPYHADNAQNALASDYGGFGKDLLSQIPNSKVISKETWETSSIKDVYLEQLNQANSLIQSRKFPFSYSKKKDFVCELVCKEFVLPLHLLPVILGENGSRMEHISEESNTVIELKIDDRKSICSFVIQGSSEEIENASHLMRLCIQILGKKTDMPLFPET